MESARTFCYAVTPPYYKHTNTTEKSGTDTDRQMGYCHLVGEQLLRLFVSQYQMTMSFVRLNGVQLVPQSIIIQAATLLTRVSDVYLLYWNLLDLQHCLFVFPFDRSTKGQYAQKGLQSLKTWCVCHLDVRRIDCKLEFILAQVIVCIAGSLAINHLVYT